ncbi:hypothetical protein IIA15_08565 [candidate division TA06 bacterium]|nr:hypothetical protein [candidate division TA06 bacterium]
MLKKGFLFFALLLIPVLAQGGEQATIIGQIVDAKCYLTMNMSGADHIKCAVKCAKSGHPLALAADNTGQLFFFIFKDPEKGLEQLIKLAEKRVEVKGEVFHEANAISVASITEIKETKGKM